MRNVETLGKPHGVERSQGVTIVILHNLKNSRAFEAFAWLCALGALTLLRHKEGITHVILHLIRKDDHARYNVKKFN
jgi:hypothetical protein